MFVLLAAAAVGWLVRGRFGGALVLVLIACLIVASFPQLSADLVGDRGLAVGVLRGAEVVCLGVAVHAAARRVHRPTTDPLKPDINGKAIQVVAVLGLCAIGAELLAAYDDSTGDAAALAFALVFFAGLYGAPALLARELVRRRGWGWPSLLLLFAALGTAQACLIDQSMFAVDYQGYEGWKFFREQTLIPALGISASNAYSFVFGHVIYSFAAPIALAEAWAPQRAREPWLSPTGIVAAALAYLGTAAVILADPESHTGSPMQLAVSSGVVVAVVAAALLVGRARATATKAGGPPVWAVLLITLVVALAPDLADTTSWRGLAVGVVASGALGVAILVAARMWGWSPRHSAAAGLGFLLARGLMAFTYFPLIGNVEPFAKYAHNTAMLIVVLIAGAVALRQGPGVLAFQAHTG
ncbi:hypothetical protein [Streptomonospora salina]|uniref:Protein-S-isoprenylcysteine O-methyltransferase Ste14 n=1 Tax=Streptomonospora salina TaxID=104205 RepID=A0A841E873_9ACTN|nr:hypothetical protein [Streptomonospora salina]MBB6000157.1 protein-S-isoprenylcysteine O-methyltransferase Ste14 [Streptomonospora salina]